MKKFFLLIFVIVILLSCSKLGSPSSKNENPLIKTGSIDKNNNITNNFDGKKIDELIDGGKYKEAESIINKYPDSNTEKLRLLSKLKFREKKYEEALKYSLKLNENTKWNNKFYLYELGVIYSNLGKIEESRKYINESLKIDPDFESAKEYIKVINKLKIQ